MVDLSLWKIWVSWDDDIPNIWKVIKFHGSKPPTRHTFQRCFVWWSNHAENTIFPWLKHNLPMVKTPFSYIFPWFLPFFSTKPQSSAARQRLLSPQRLPGPPPNARCAWDGMGKWWDGQKTIGKYRENGVLTMGKWWFNQQKSWFGWFSEIYSWFNTV